MKLVKEDLYFNLLYQISYNFNLTRDKKKKEELQDYLSEIFGYSNGEQAKLLKKVQNAPTPKHTCNIRISSIDGLTPDKPSDATTNKKNRFYVTAGLSGSKDRSATSIRDTLKWDDVVKLPITEANLNDYIHLTVWNFVGYSGVGQFVSELFSTLGSNQQTELSMPEIISAGKKASQKLATAVIPIKAITPSTAFTWQLRDKRNLDNNESLIRLKVAFSIEDLKFDSLPEYGALFETLLRYELKESGVTDHWWDGKFSKVGDNLLQYYKCDHGLAPADIELEQWKVFCDIQSSRPLAFILFHDTLEKIEQFIMKECYNESQLNDFWRSTTGILADSLNFIKSFKFDNERRVTNCLKLLNKISQTIALERLGLMPSSVLNDVPSVIFDKNRRWSVEELIVASLKENAESWFQGEIAKYFDEVEVLMQVITSFGNRLESLVEIYQNVFKKFININLIDTYYTSLESQLLEFTLKTLKNIPTSPSLDLSNSSPETDKTILQLKNTLKAYHLFKTLIEKIKTLPLPQKKNINLENFYTMFIDFVPLWFKINNVELQKNIERAVSLNQKLEPGTRHSSSAADTFDIIYVLFVDWKLIDLPINDKYEKILVQILKDVSNLAETYIDNLVNNFRKRTNLEDYKKISHDETLNKSVENYGELLSNIKFMGDKLQVIFEEFINFVKSKDEKAAELIRKVATIQLESSKGRIENQWLLATNNLRNELRTCLGTLIKENFEILAKKPNAFDEVFKFLDKLLTKFYDVLTEDYFNLVLSIVWTELITILKFSTEKSISENQDVALFSNLLKNFKELELMFNKAELDPEETSRLDELRQKLQMYGCSSSQLVYSYYATMFAYYQTQTEPMNLGVLTVKAALGEDHLEVQILNGRDLAPHPSKVGQKPDTYVETQLFFDLSDVEMKSVKTKVQEKNQFPLYDETFKIPLTREQLNTDDTIVAFTLWDPDYMGVVQNYMCECYLSFQQIKASKGEQIHLNLIRPPPQHPECVTLIKIRTDKYSTKFIRLLKIRTGDNNFLDATLNLNRNLGKSMKSLLIK